jgi:glycosyltransferase involved in cell wall biosynthesis
LALFGLVGSAEQENSLPSENTHPVTTSGYRLSIVLPAYNEEANIPEAVARATDVAADVCQDFEIIVVDDGSVDRTGAIVTELAAADPRVRLITHRYNLGYGEALRTGFKAARMDLVFFTDADNQFDLKELKVFLPWSDRVDVVAGYRINRQDSFGRRVNALIWNYFVRVLFYVPVRDIDCAFKLFRREVLEQVDIRSVGALVNTELMVKAGRAGASVVEIGVSHYPRTAGKARGANPRVVLMALTEVFQMKRRLQRMDAGIVSLHPDGPPAR